MMKILRMMLSLRTTSILTMLIPLVAGTALADEIKIGGTGNALGTMRLMGDAFSKDNPSIHVTVLSSIGSSGAVKAVPRGAVDIGLTSRALTADELATGLVAIEYARTPTVMAVSTKSSVTAISREQIAELYAGKLAKWPDGTLIRPVLRQPGDENTKQIKALSADIEHALAAAEQRSGLAFAVTDQEAADKIETIPGAIGVSSLALIKSENRALRPLKLDSIEPTVKNGASGVYPMAKHLFLLIQPTPSAAVKRFVEFVRSPAGRNILAQTGHWIP